MTQDSLKDSSTYWKKSRVELRAAGFDPDRTAKTTAVVTIASAWTNAHRCNNRVRGIADLLVELLAERGGQGLVVGAPAVSDALTQGTPTAGYSLVMAFSKARSVMMSRGRMPASISRKRASTEAAACARTSSCSALPAR